MTTSKPHFFTTCFPPTSDFALRPRTHALTTTGPELYSNHANDSGICTTFPNPLTTTGSGIQIHTHQASATASTSLCVVLPLIH